jgi:SecD/SecF fusion protein
VAERRGHLILVGLILAALVGVAALAIPRSPVYKKPTLGLDLQGGFAIVLKAVPPEGRKLTDSDLDRSVEIMRNRVDKIGVSEPEIRKQDPDQIVIELPGIRNFEAAASLIGKPATLELYDLETSLAPVSVRSTGIVIQPLPRASLYSLLASVQGDVRQDAADSWYLFDKAKRRVAGPLRHRDDVFATTVVKRMDGKIPKSWRLFGVPEGTVVISCGGGAVVCPGVNASPVQPTFYYLFKYQPNNQQDPIPQMTGKDLRLSGTRQDFDTQRGGEPIVLMQFTDEGDKKFQDVTRDVAQRGQQVFNQIQQHDAALQHFAIVLDREIKSFPTIDFEQYPNGIGGGNGAQISGLESVQEAKDLALVLQTGALPVNFTTLDSTEVSATLGADSLHEAVRAAIAGLAIVALFLLLVYRFLGLVAVVGLGIYAAFLYAVVLLFGVTLTLPGFAGMILTLGVAADANVVIFERIKEEFRAGKSVRAAIAAGYAKGFHTIVDANVVTAITALVLFAVATASVKGFALMLLLGTLISLLTAVAATRAILGLLAGFSWFDNPRFMGASAQQTAKWIQIDFMKRRYLWFAISGAVMLISVASLATKGLNLGIDFKGGTQIRFETPQPQPLEDVRAQAARIGQGGAQIQGVGKETDGRFGEFLIRTKSLDQADQRRLTNDLEEEFGRGRELSIETRNVSASFGRQIARGALLAIAFSIFLIILYIGIRFQFKFAGPVIAALIHDILITVGIYSLIGAEVSTPTVAAVLTVLGYSIYDTIIIFDRIRENVPLMRRSSFATIANVSLWEVMRRSLATTFITLLPVGSLLLFGGETLKDFAFALLVGIGSGAYSSIFIAAPLLTIWKEREPEYARRKDVDEVARRPAEEVLEEAEEAAAAEPAPTPELVPVAGAERSSAQAKRERRKQRRRTRPHGRAR